LNPDLDLDVDLDLEHSAARELPQARGQPVRNTLPAPGRASPMGCRSDTGLADQLRRASLSIPLNIAEGSGKTTGPDQRRFYAIARGCALECAAIIDACGALGLLEAAQAEQANDLLTSRANALEDVPKLSRNPGPGPGLGQGLGLGPI
jgi:four helix bundle protein